MKITHVDVMALEKDLGCGGSRPIIVKIYTDEGIDGIGEAGVAIGTGSRGAFEVLKDFAPMIIGMDPLANEVIWEKLFKCSFWGQGNGAIMMSAISAVDTALWDIKGKAANMPLYQLLGGKQRPKLRAYASQIQFGWGVDSFNPAAALSQPEQYAEAALKAVEQGYTAVKGNFLRFDENGKILDEEPCQLGILLNDLGYDVQGDAENDAGFECGSRGMVYIVGEEGSVTCNGDGLQHTNQLTASTYTFFQYLYLAGDNTPHVARLVAITIHEVVLSKILNLDMH